MENDEDFEEPENPVEEVNSKCNCANDLNVTCRFTACPDYSNDSYIFSHTLSSIKSFIEEEKTNFEKKKIQIRDKKIWHRNFDFEKS